ncbi:MAG: glycine C-acetyltransferase [Candidatus Kerfeldbacteria bacterium RIFCSPLOWO2_01_FULL_48_11]|uniref:2-amino-3-ketobutyrate coenzyme A ligase n=1 Tax=Candidatus Kerfeldbacteria bacterium RIFCSPLOWO2_01_FULL_48_11 TaxID=1798543 RepID=A0A1G2B2C6_9BACT|nr:MAG: 2-amino-3-ketobutyrate coenzyme A ligase [Parcubacteria group bacterium GW2011_GWA2_48_9]KKW13813.1 MAG: 2-amino-3-ketobutyrate coenzyme A ligase [Parcubacteria group bacterium GW2011_GWC2_49_9]OGY83308.1 MAG: glycine C-acetyltransferase [Candidatus Kerfeldbacteria bacterium RIFCSPLOWO2_01_FULL_48_11]HCM67447.1 glycine C-acetyltransferase [Candidatus Kerfeldbacteria bacterium]
MYTSLKKVIEKTSEDIRSKGLWKTEREIQSPQGAEIIVNGKRVINFCANNYLGMANNPAVVEAAKQALDTYGYGLSSVRFICGTQEQHRKLERTLASFVKMDDVILYSSCFDANAGLFETLLGEEDAIISDELNHASIIDGVRLCKAQRYRYLHHDMADLEAKLKESQAQRIRLIVTDGVFSMDGEVAKLKEICDLADTYGTVVMVDDSHATGVLGAHGHGSLEETGTEGRVDIITSTFGKAFGGASGGFTAARQEIVDLLRQRSRPYLFSNSLAPMIVGTTQYILDHADTLDGARKRLHKHTLTFRTAMNAAGFATRGESHPIVPIMLGDAKIAATMAADILAEGIYVIGFWYPVVPQGKARIRVQISAAHTDEHVQKAINAFTKIGKKHGII